MDCWRYIALSLKIPPLGYQSVSDAWSLASPVRKVEFKLTQFRRRSVCQNVCLVIGICAIRVFSVVDSKGSSFVFNMDAISNPTLSAISSEIETVASAASNPTLAKNARMGRPRFTACY